MKKSAKDFNLIIDLLPMLSKTFLSKRLYKDLAPAELNQTHIKALMFIHFNDNIQMNELSSKLHIEKGSFTPVANKLIDLTYIKKTPSTLDKRKVYLSLTKKGENLVVLLKESYLKAFEDNLNLLSEEDQLTLISSAENLITLLDKINTINNLKA
ncbi:MAG: MarR family winged helix-turn-helix transcriptional regulator [Sarcina sp.]